MLSRFQLVLSLFHFCVLDELPTSRLRGRDGLFLWPELDELPLQLRPIGHNRLCASLSFLLLSQCGQHNTDGIQARLHSRVRNPCVVVVCCPPVMIVTQVPSGRTLLRLHRSDVLK